MSAYETTPCTACGEPTIAAQPVCSLCEADKGLFAPPAAAPAPADPEFSRWWTTPDQTTGHAPSATLDIYSAQRAWAAARAIPSAPAPVPESKCPMKAFLDKLNSPDPAVRAEAEAHAERVADELSQARPRRAPAAEVAPVVVAGGRFEHVGTVWHERVNDEYHANLNEGLVTEGEVLYRFVPDQAAGTAPAASVEDGLNIDEITRLRDALVWMGESTYESLEECAIYRLRLIRRLISAVLGQRDQFRAQCELESAPGGPLKDHEIRDAVNRLRDVAIQFHHTQQLRSRIQDIVLPLLNRGHQA